MWGLGHATAVAGVAVLALLFKSWLPLEALSSWSERIVGVVLIAVGLWGLRTAFRTRVHGHVHAHGGVAHHHVHRHDGSTAHVPAPRATPEHQHTHAAFGIGTLHGLAGSSHLFAVLPALALPGVPAAAGYLAGYGIGTVLGMTSFASLMGWLAGRARHRGPSTVRGLLSACSCAAIAVGAFWLAA